MAKPQLRPPQNDPSKLKRKFSSFFKSLVIELDKELYGPDNHLVEWHRTATTQETDGFQVRDARAGMLGLGVARFVLSWGDILDLLFVQLSLFSLMGLNGESRQFRAFLCYSFNV